MITQTPICKGKQDWNLVGKGLPSCHAIKDPETRRFLEAAVQNLKYVHLKVQDIRPIDEEDEKKQLDYDLSKRPVPPPNRGPEAVLRTATWKDPDNIALTGGVNPHGHSTSYLYQYTIVQYNMDTDSYPAADFVNDTVYETSTDNAGSGNVLNPVSFILRDCLMVRRYYFRIKAWNEIGTCYSNIKAVDTCKNPEVTLDEASKITADSAILSGTVNPHGLETVCYFSYGTTPDCGTTTTPQNIGAGESPVGVEAEITGLTESTDYYYKLVAENACGLTDSRDNGKDQYCSGGFRSEIKRFRTLSSLAPIVFNYGATSLAMTSAKLEGKCIAMSADTVWTFKAGTSHGNETYGDVTVDVIKDEIGHTNGTTRAGGTSYLEWVVSELTPGVQYYCQVTGQSAAGTAYSDIYGFRTPLPKLTISGSLDFGTWFVGESGTVTKTVTITNSGEPGSVLDWIGSISLSGYPEGKISQDVGSGSLLAGDSQVVTIVLTKDGVTSGEYEGEFTANATYCEEETLPAEADIYPVYTGDIHMKADIVYSESPYPPGTDCHIDADVSNVAVGAWNPCYSVQYYPARYVRFFKDTTTNIWYIYWTGGSPSQTYPVEPTFRLSDGCPSASSAVSDPGKPYPIGWGAGSGTVTITPP